MIDLAELKEWLRVSSIDDDNKLNELIIARLGFISNYCNRLFFETVSDFENSRDTLSLPCPRGTGNRKAQRNSHLSLKPYS